MDEPTPEDIKALLDAAMEVVDINATVAAAYYLRLIELGVNPDHAARITAGFVGGYGNTAPKMVSQVS